MCARDGSWQRKSWRSASAVKSGGMSEEDVATMRGAKRKRNSRFGSWAVMAHVLRSRAARHSSFPGGDLQWPTDGPVVWRGEAWRGGGSDRNQSVLAVGG